MQYLRHVVLFQFKDGTTQDTIHHVNQEFRKLKDAIDELKDFEMGTNNSPEGISHGYTHGYTLTFHSEEGREAYLVHPAHKAFQGIVDPTLTSALAFDYWAS